MSIFLIQMVIIGKQFGDPSHYSEEYYEEIKDDYPVLYINDLSFDGKKYIIESIEDGQPSSVSALYSEYSYYVLVNDNTVTWDDIEHGMLSSQSGDFIDHYLVYSDLEM